MNMSKRYACVILAVILLVLCGCAPSKSEQPVTTPSAVTQATTQPTTAPTQPTTPEPTQPTTVPTQPSTGLHVHSYTSSVVKKATCTVEGTKKFTCSCGDSYTETIKAKGHTWGKWLQIVTSNTLDPTGTYRICSACKAEERSVNYSSMLKKYVTLIGWLNRAYTAPSQITAEEAAKALPMILSVLPEFTEDPSVATRTYPVADLNACAKKCFGRSFDFTGVQNISMYGYGTISYDAAKSALVWSFPYGQDIDWHKTVFDSFTPNGDNTQFTVKYHYEYKNGSQSDTCTFTVKLENGNYVITSVSQ